MSYDREWHERNPEKSRELYRRRRVRQRIEVIERYGGCCAFCGSVQLEHLTIDHINGKGTEHRAGFRGKYDGMASFLYRTEFRPDLYRVLCWNCHMAVTNYDVQPDGQELHDMTYWKEFSKLRQKVSR